MIIKSNTQELIELIGSPFINDKAREFPADKLLIQVYDSAFYDRVAPLYLYKYRHEGWHPELEKRYNIVRDRESKTLTILSELAKNLKDWNENGYVIFKSIKPYPAIPNDTDVLIFGRKKEFHSALDYLYRIGYVFHEWAPMQTTLYDPRGKGKIGSGKKGGTYYIDVYREVSTDYVCYLSKNVIRSQVIVKQLNGVNVRLLRPEVDLAVILFHNIFPERTFTLEQFYMPLYYLADPKFDIDLFVRFTEENKMSYAVKTNLSLVEQLHNTHFNFIPNKLIELLDYLGRNENEVNRFIKADMKTPYLFSPKTFWTVCMVKLRDQTFVKSLFVQAVHMLNPFFFWDVLLTLKRRFSERGVYHME